MTQTHFVGIDVAKAKLDVVALLEKKAIHKVFKNTPVGFKALLEWLKKHTEIPCVCMEATGHYSEGIAEFLHAQQIKVSVINPYQIKQFARMKLARNKNDKADAKLIAEYGKEQIANLNPFKPRTAAQKQLRDYMLIQKTLKEQKVQLSNKADSLHSSEPIKTIQEAIKQLDKQIEDLEVKISAFVNSEAEFKKNAERLIEIEGMGKVSAHKILAHIPNIEQFNSAKELAAYVGVCPRQCESGKYQGKTRMSKIGSAALRNALYMPALSAKRHNKHLKPFVARLEKSGLKPKAIVGALMRKLIHIIYGMFKHDRPFDPALACKA